MPIQRPDLSSAISAPLDELERLMLETSAERVDILDRDGRLVAINAIGRDLLEAEGAEPRAGVAWELLWSEPSRAGIRAALQRVGRGASTELEATSAASQPPARRWRVKICPLRDERGRPARCVAVSRTDDAPAGDRAHRAHEDRASEQLRLRDEQLRLAITGAALGTWHWDFRTGQLAWSDLAFAMFGLEPRPDMTYEQFAVLIHPADRDAVSDAVQRAIREHADYDMEFRVVWPDRSIHWIGGRGRALYDAQGTPLRMEGVAIDITARKRTERALREGEERFIRLSDAIPHLIWEIGFDGKLTYANRRWYDYYQRDTLEPGEWTALVHPDDLARAREGWSGVERGGSSVEVVRLRRHDGRYFWFACCVVPVRDADGRMSHMVGTATDIDRLKKTEDALRESRARLDTALHAAGMGTWVWNMETGAMQLDASLTQLMGLSPDDIARLTMEACIERVHPDEQAAVRACAARARELGAEFDVECRVACPDGRQIWVAAKGRVAMGVAGRMLFGAIIDMTQHKRLEEALRQAQKMEAIGQLAGGVAHDFNNLLMVILGQASLISAQPCLPDSVHLASREIVAASERAASLTAQLLAFGRRQSLQAREIDLNEIVVSVGQMLKRLIGEHVTLEIEPAVCAPRLRADPNMLVQVLLNLALNARDAMPEGGRLTIRTSREVLDERSAQAIPEARAGTWACLTVRDNGTGIALDILPRIFEPFFTTKEVGKGTGLGLATVYGIVKQHRGFIAVDSAPGCGTTFQAFLPLPSQEEAMSVPAPPVQAASGGDELILLVEDDAAVRATISSILERHNYRLVVADDGMQALALFAARGLEIDLLLSDVVLPGSLSGVDLAQQLRAQNPRLQVILCSGYSFDKIDQGMEALPGLTFLQKPYRAEQLLSLMRGLLDKPRELSRTGLSA